MEAIELGKGEVGGLGDDGLPMDVADPALEIVDGNNVAGGGRSSGDSSSGDVKNDISTSNDCIRAMGW